MNAACVCVYLRAHAYVGVCVCMRESGVLYVCVFGEGNCICESCSVAERISYTHAHVRGRLTDRRMNIHTQPNNERSCVRMPPCVDIWESVVEAALIKSMHIEELQEHI